MMLLKSKNYPNGKYQFLWLTANNWKSYLNFNKSLGFWNHPKIPIGAYANWTIRLVFIEIKKWYSEEQLNNI